MRLLILCLFAFALLHPSHPDDLEDWDVRDLTFRQKESLASTFSNRSHSVSGAAFSPEGTVILTTSMKATWVYVPFPETPALKGEFVKELRKRFDATIAATFGSPETFCRENGTIGKTFPLFYRRALGDLWRSISRYTADLNAIRRSATVFVNNTGQNEMSRTRRVVPHLIAAATATIFEPVLRKVGCAVLSPIGFCRDPRAQRIEALYEELRHLQGRVRQLEEGAWLTHVVEPPQDPNYWDEPVLSANSSVNEGRLLGLIPNLKTLVEHVDRDSVCSRYNHKYSEFKMSVLHLGLYDNITAIVGAMAAEVEQRRVTLQTFGSLLHDALGSLVHGFLPTTLIPPDALVNILQRIPKGVLVEAIPRNQLSAYYSFEIVRETYISDRGLHILLEIPLHASAGMHTVMRATPLPQPIPGGRGTATQYKFRKSLLLLSWDRTNFAEVTEEKLLAHCQGTGRLKLCKKPFATTVSQRTTCLTGLYFNLVSVVLKLCDQEVIPLPQQPQAEYIYDSTYLLTSADGNFLMQNFTEGHKAQKMNGCQSCLIKPSCNGRIQLPSGGLVLRPDPETCMSGGEGATRILPAPQLRAVFGALSEFTPEVPYSLISDLQGELLDHVRLNLAQLNDEDLTDAAIENLVQPFIDQARLSHGVGMKWLVRRVVIPVISGIFAMSLAAGCIFLGRRSLWTATKECLVSMKSKKERRAISQKLKELREEARAEEDAVPRLYISASRSTPATETPATIVAELHEPPPETSKARGKFPRRKGEPDELKPYEEK